MKVRLLYHDPDRLGGVSTFDEAILRIVRADNVCLACPYIGLAYLRRVIRLTESWRLLTDVQEWLRSQDRTQRERVYEFLVDNRFLVRHSPDFTRRSSSGRALPCLGQRTSQTRAYGSA